MRSWIITIILVLLVGIAVFDFVTDDRGKVSDKAEEQIEINNENTDVSNSGLDLDALAPNFSLQNLDGEKVSLKDFKGEPVMINFWASWCPPCKAEMPDMQKFYEKTNMPILSVNMTDTERKPEKISKFLDELGIDFPVLLDEEGEIGDLYEVLQLPTTYFLDEEGKVHFKLAGPMNYDFMMEQYKKLH